MATITSIQKLSNKWIYTLSNSDYVDVYVNYKLYAREMESPIEIIINSENEPHVEIIESIQPRTINNRIFQSIVMDYKNKITWRGNPSIQEYRIYEIINNNDVFRKSIPETFKGYYFWLSENKNESGTYQYRIDFIKNSQSYSSEIIECNLIVPTDKEKYNFEYDSYTNLLTIDYDKKYLPKGKI